MKRLLPLGLGKIFGITLLASVAHAQGVLVVINPPSPVPLPRPIIRPQPTPPMSYKIKELSVQARLDDQVARVQVSQSFVNTGSRQMEVSFVFPLPYDGAIDRLTFMVDGKEYEAKLLPSDKARSIYEGYISRNQDPALLEWIGTGMFKTSVFPIPPGAERTVTLHYNQLLRKDHGLTDFLFPLRTAQYTSKPVEKVDIRITISSSTEIKNIYSPTHLIETERPEKNLATVRYLGENEIPSSDFRLFYDAAQGELNANVISYRGDPEEDGYFLLLASPQVRSAKAERPPKNVVFVVDRSGSMSGKKIEQVRDALTFVLNELHEGDLFNIVAYDSSVETFRPEMERYNEDSRKQALAFVKSIYAGGATNIDSALTRAMGMLVDSSRPNFVIFLTDGQPTAGETNEAQIAANAKKNNPHHVRIVSFGVGYDVNSRLLDRLARDNYGQSEYVRPNENIESHVSRLYQKISSPVMTNVAVKFELDDLPVEDGSPTNRMYPGEVYDLFEGEQLVLVGRYRKPGAARVTLSGQVGSETKSFAFPAEFTDDSPDESFVFVEKLWAMRRIGNIIDELDLVGKNEELIKELVALSTKHGILTPYTSYLADENSSVRELADARSGKRGALRRTRKALERLDAAEGVDAFSQRAEKQRLMAANLAPSAALNGAGNGGAFFRDEDDNAVRTNAVRPVGKDTLYKRGKTWIAAGAAEEDLEKAEREMRIKRIKRFSKDYFDLVRANTKSENQMLAVQQAGEELVVKLRGQLYRIE